MSPNSKSLFRCLSDNFITKLQYFGDNSNLHGIGYVYSLSYIPFYKRFFWIMVLACCFLGAAKIFLEALSLYSAGAVSYSVETNYLDWSTPFPALTVCEQMDAERVKSRINKFHPKLTEYGTCFVFNSRMSGNETGILNVNRGVGLPDLIFSAVAAVMVRVHSPHDEVSVAMENLLGKSSPLMLVTDLDVILRTEQTISDVSVQSVPSSVRGCLFAHEQPTIAAHWPFHSYSYSACVLYCRAQAQEQTCNCTHHFMPKLDGVPLCNIQGLSCLSKNKDSLANANCECPMACEEVQYKVVHTFYNRETDKLSDELIARGSRGRLRLAELPTLRVCRQAIRGTLGLVVDIGGVGGVFFGASVLSVIEIIYLLCIRKSSD